MEIKTFRASNLQQALSLVRQELGPDAVVLQTKEVRSRGMWGLLAGAASVEVTASLEVRVAERMPDLNSMLSDHTDEPEPEMAEHDAYFEADIEPDDVPEDEPEHEPQTPWPTERLKQDGPALATSRKLAEELELAQGLRKQLESMHAAMEQFCHQNGGFAHKHWPAEVKQLHARLLQQGWDDALAHEVAEAALTRANTADATGRQPVDFGQRIGWFARQVIEDWMLTAAPIGLHSGRQHVIAFVGPTGVGKTTTIAKLAAAFRLRQQRKVGLITVDTYRIAAIEQLKTYAQIMDLPLAVVNSPSEMARTADAMMDMDVLLVDTAGRSPRDEVKVRETKAYLQALDVDETHLVLSSTSAPRNVAEAIERFDNLGVNRLLLTKWDEAACPANLLPALRASQIPISYVTFGQNVPDDIAPAEAAMLAARIIEFTETTAKAA